MIDKMNNTKFTDNELNLMSYQDLRRLSILLRLPANIKKTYMISMIQAHQKGDGFTKTAIANKVMEERKVKRLSSKGRQAKPFLMVSSTTTQQIPTDLSVSTKHEFETRFSYVAHYTSKDNSNSGSISRIIKEETEVSRRNRNILQQSRKSSRKLSAMGRTEIMLPRNHSLTTPVRLMPQYERGYSPLTQYETVSGLSNGKTHFQDNSSYNYHFHGEYSNTLMSSSSTHEMYRNESYWHPQGIYEKYVKSGGLVESQAFQSNTANSTIIVNASHYPEDTESGYKEGEGNFVVAKNDLDFEAGNPAEEDIAYQQQYNRRDDTVICHVNNVQSYTLDEYSPRTPCEQASGNHGAGNNRDFAPCVAQFLGTGEADESFGSPGDPAFKKSVIQFQANLKMNNVEVKHCRVNSPDSAYYQGNQVGEFNRFYVNEERNWVYGSEATIREKEWRKSFDANNVEGVPESALRESLLPDVSESSNECNGGNGQDDKYWGKKSVEGNRCRVSLQRCRYISGHNKHPEMDEAKREEAANSSVALPSFWSAFCTYGANNKAYSLCRNSFTGTTEAHVNPIMTSTYAAPYLSQENPQMTSNNPEESPQETSPWVYPYPESQSTFTVENAATYSTWNEYSNETGNKLAPGKKGHEVQVVKCRKHGCHYLYLLSNSCN